MIHSPFLLWDTIRDQEIRADAAPGTVGVKATPMSIGQSKLKKDTHLQGR